jgi:large subunit ribosomal protein L29
MKAKDLRERSDDELRDLEKSLAKDTFTARFKNFTNRLDDTSSIGKNRRDLARVKTLLRERGILAVTKAASPEGEPAKAEAPKATKPAKAAKAVAPKAPKKTTAKKTAKKSEAK